MNAKQPVEVVVRANKLAPYARRTWIATMRKPLKHLSNFHSSLTLWIDRREITDCIYALTCDITLHNGVIGDLYG
jgi:hypothetical protein